MNCYLIQTADGETEILRFATDNDRSEYQFQNDGIWNFYPFDSADDIDIAMTPEPEPFDFDAGIHFKIVQPAMSYAQARETIQRQLEHIVSELNAMNNTSLVNLELIR